MPIGKPDDEKPQQMLIVGSPVTLKVWCSGSKSFQLDPIWRVGYVIGAKARLFGEYYTAALARCVVVRFSPTMNDGFRVHIV
jgi:hypothetical protein